MMPKQIYCFRCNGFRDATGSVQRSWGFGPRWFCKQHAAMALALTDEQHGTAVDMSAIEPKRAQVEPKRPKTAKPKGQISLAAWCREAAKTMTFDQVVEALAKEFPGSKPGQNPKLAKGYVTCYLKRGAT